MRAIGFTRRVVLSVILLFAGLPAVAGSPSLPEPPAGQVVLVDFWASWCTPCRHSFGWMNEMQKKYHDQGLVIMAVNVDKERRLAERFLARHPARFDVVYDPEARLAEQFGVIGMPASFLLDRNGEIIDSHVGFKRGEAWRYEAVIAAALRQ